MATIHDFSIEAIKNNYRLLDSVKVSDIIQKDIWICYKGINRNKTIHVLYNWYNSQIVMIEDNSIQICIEYANALK